MHLVPVPINVLCYSNSNPIVRRSEVTLRAQEPTFSPPARGVWPLEDPLLLFSVLYGLWIANTVAFNGAVLRELSEQFLALAEKQAMVARVWLGIGTWACCCY